MLAPSDMDTDVGLQRNRGQDKATAGRLNEGELEIDPEIRALIVWQISDAVQWSLPPFPPMVLPFNTAYDCTFVKGSRRVIALFAPGGSSTYTQ